MFPGFQRFSTENKESSEAAQRRFSMIAAHNLVLKEPLYRPLRPSQTSVLEFIDLPETLLDLRKPEALYHNAYSCEG
jgi:hypothetical protein